jgi:hypothetical protein
MDTHGKLRKNILLMGMVLLDCKVKEESIEELRKIIRVRGEEYG